MGLGYTWVLTVISFIRELLGGGTLLAGTSFKVEVIPEQFRIGILNSAPGGFLVFGFLIAITGAIRKNSEAKKAAKKNISEEASK